MPAFVRALALLAASALCPSLALAYSPPYAPPRLLAQWGHRGSDPDGFSAVSAVGGGYVYAADVAGRVLKFGRYGEVCPGVAGARR